MSCLLPQFKCPPDIFAVKFLSQSHLHTSKRTEDIDFQTNCALITTSPPTSISTPVIDFEKLKLSSSLEAIPNSSLNDGSWIERTLLNLEKIPSLDTHPIASDQTWTYVGGIGSPSEVNDEVLDKETLLTSEEAIIAAAASEALALAKAAVQVAKDAAVIINNRKSIKPNGTETGTLPVVEASSVGNSGKIFSSNGTKLHWSDRDYSSPHEESDDVEPTAEELDFLEVQLSKNITVRSNRQTERKDRRTRAAKNMAATTMLPLKSSSSSRKKRSPVQEIDYSDPLRYLRGITTSCRLLSASEEQELSKGIQVLLKLERLHEELQKRFDGEPTFSQWASAAGVDQKTLRKQLNHGTLCKDRMIKSNLRLVVSIAKNYQGCGMNLQDLVQEGCRGLVRGAEKFDASKGFKFSTYAHWWIKQAVRKALSDHSRTIRLPFHMVEAGYRVKEARKQLYCENGRLPTEEEVAVAAGLSMKRLSAVMMTPKPPLSLDRKVGINEDLKPSDIIADPEAETSEDVVSKQFMRRELEKVLESLNPRERQVVRLRFGLEDGRLKTLQEIGEFLGVSRERVRQIEACAFRKLKNKNRTKALNQYLLP